MLRAFLSVIIDSCMPDNKLTENKIISMSFLYPFFVKTFQCSKGLCLHEVERGDFQSILLLDFQHVHERQVNF